MSEVRPTSRTTLRRLPKRGVFDRGAVHAILDEGLICHVGVTVDGKPVVLPTGYARDGDWIYLHGSAKNAALAAMVGRDACVTVTLLDGIVLARSTFHHSFNYRSVVLYGRGEAIDEPAAKERALERIVEHIVPGRSAEARGANAQELKATRVVRFPVEECSAKVRTGPPSDDEEDMALDVWAGVLPVTLEWGPPEPDEATDGGPPEYLARYRRP